MSDSPKPVGQNGSTAPKARSRVSKPVSRPCAPLLPGTIKLVIPEATPSLNALHGHHWSKKYRLRSRWAWLIRAARMEAGVSAQHWERATMILDRWGPRVLDTDNFIAGTKCVTDCLVREGFFVDDSPSRLSVTYCQHIGQPKTEITLGAL